MTTPSTSSAPGSTYATLVKGKSDRYRSMGAFGKPAHQNYVQLRAMLRAKRGDKFANYLAQPSYDPDAGELRWTAEVPGAARRWSELNDAEQMKGALNLEMVRGGLKGFIEELKVQGGGQTGGATAFATLLEQAMLVPGSGDEFLYFVGDQPVIAFWGFQDQQGRSADPTFAAPRYLPGDAGAPIGEASVAAPLALVPERRRPWWWWALWALLALLLLLALLFGLRSCQSPAVQQMLPEVLREQPQASAPQDGQPPSEGGTTPGPNGSTSGGSSTTTEGTPPGSSIDPSMPGASAPGAAVPMPGDAPKDPNAPPMPDAKPDDPAKDPAKDPSKDPNDPSKDKDKDPKKDASKNPGKDPKKDDKGKTDPPKPPVDPKALKIPDKPADAKKMDFLEGEWKAGEGLADRDTQTPLDLGIKFGKDGKGELTLRRPDGSTCKGPVQGSMNGAKLSVDGSQSIPCSDGKRYPAPKIECARDTGGQTPCQGVNADGSRYNMGIRRQ